MRYSVFLLIIIVATHLLCVSKLSAQNLISNSSFSDVKPKANKLKEYKISSKNLSDVVDWYVPIYIHNLSREETIKGMTIWAAFANFEEKEKGSLEKGKFADFILVDTDLMTCPENVVLKTQVLKTYVNGEQVYSK